jgi:hypothetical protein
MGKLSPQLEEWRRTAPPTEERTVVVRPLVGTAPAEAATDLATRGIRVQSAGAGPIIVVVNPLTLALVASIAWVAAVEEPKRLFPKR